MPWNALDTVDLRPEAIDQVGGKAANFGFLRRTIPENAPAPALALSFDLWFDFMAQPAGEGTLRESIASDLTGFAFPPDVARLRPVLEAVRERIKEATFTSEQRVAVLAALRPFAAVESRRIRFRSSTNVEDSEVFSGAGLYDSFSGCLADDTDGDTAGPSHCDPDRRKERGVFRAIKKVYASFYNENAFIERLRHEVEESAVGMAILAHHAFPDEIELANGVATLLIQPMEEGMPRSVEAQVVSKSRSSHRR